MTDLDPQFAALLQPAPAQDPTSSLDPQFAALLPSAQSQQQPATATDWLKAAGSAAVRPIAQAAASLPMLAADSGVAIGNLVSGNLNWNGSPKRGAYPLPSTTFNQALDSVTQPPQGVGKLGELASTVMLSTRLPSGVTQGAPSNFTGATQQQVLKQQLLQKAQDAGYVVPPGTVNPTFLNRLLGGIAGKAKLQQAATAANQPVTDALAGQAMHTADALSPDVLQQTRNAAYASGYAPIDAFGTMTHTAQFGPKLDALLATVNKAQGAYPGLPKASSQVVDTLNALKAQPTVDSAGARATVQYLRDQADASFGGANKADGAAYKGAAGALEDEIAANLSAAGKPGQALLQNFQDARKLIAQTYTVGKAVVGDTGNVDATKIARQLSGKPYASGPLKTISDFATLAPKSAKLSTEAGESISPLDMYGSIAAAAASHSLGPLGIPLTRSALQSYLLSPAGQRRALQQFAPSAAKPNMGLMGTFPALNQTSGLFGQ